VVPRHRDHLAPGALGRHPERIAVALHDQHRNLHGVELADAALRRIVGLAGRMHREREAEDCAGVDLGRRAAGHAGSSGAPTDDERKPLERVAAQLLDDGLPSRVELLGRRGRLAPGDDIGLLDERYRQPRLVGCLSCGDEVRRLNPSCGAMAEDQAGCRLRGRLDLNASGTVGCLYFDGESTPR
jgi:hypothetical protein